MAQGEFASTPFAHLVLYIYQRRSSGTLVVDTTREGTDPEARVRVLFHRGRAVAAHIPGSHEALDQALLPLCAVSQGRYEFFEEDFVGSGPSIVTGMFDPFAFVTQAARHYSRDDSVEQVLGRFGDTPLCVQPGMDLERMGLSPRESSFAEVLRDGTATVASLCASGRMPEPEARRLMYAFLITKVVGPFASVGPEMPSMPPRGTSGLPVGPHSADRGSAGANERRRQSGAAWAAIAARASQASRPLSGPISAAPSHPRPSRRAAPASPHSTPSSASSGTNTAAQPSGRAPSRTPTATHAVPMRARTSPDGPSSPLPERAISEPLPVQNSRAPRITTPSRPISRVTPRLSSEPIEMLDEDSKLRRVLQLCQRNAFDEALPIIRGLVEQDRKNPSYLGLLASVLYGQGTGGTISKEIVETVNQALRLHPDEVHALYTKARCYKRMGKPREALHYFRRTVTVDPGHLDAARELRLLMLRQGEKGKR